MSDMPGWYRDENLEIDVMVNNAFTHRELAMAIERAKKIHQEMNGENRFDALEPLVDDYWDGMRDGLSDEERLGAINILISACLRSNPNFVLPDFD